MPGNSETIVIDLVDAYGQSTPADKLLGATARAMVRATATSPDLLFFNDTTHLVVDAHEATLSLTFLSADTQSLALGEYVYQVELYLASGETSIVVPWAPINVDLGGSAANPTPTFDNTVALSHDYGLSGELRYMSPGGSPISGAQVRVYLKSAYDAGTLDSPVGITQTDARGNWMDPVLVAPGFTYVVQFFKPNEFGPDTATVVALGVGP